MFYFKVQTADAENITKYNKGVNKMCNEMGHGAMSLMATLWILLLN